MNGCIFIFLAHPDLLFRLLAWIILQDSQFQKKTSTSVASIKLPSLSDNSMKVSIFLPTFFQVIMIASFLKTGAKALTTRSAASTLSTQQYATSRVSGSGLARFMSTDSSDASIVDVCTDKIRAALETDDVKVMGAYDDPNGSHISIEVTSAMFEGKRAVQRQQLVYKAIWEELQGPVHAVDSMICKTPDEA
jgi:BolA protein